MKLLSKDIASRNSHRVGEFFTLENLMTYWYELEND